MFWFVVYRLVVLTVNYFHRQTAVAHLCKRCGVPDIVRNAALNTLFGVMPAEAGSKYLVLKHFPIWIPARAGMTGELKLVGFWYQAIHLIAALMKRSHIHKLRRGDSD